jgi:hypothetical protein
VVIRRSTDPGSPAAPVVVAVTSTRPPSRDRLWVSPASAYTQIVNEALNGNREGRILTIVFGVIPISLVLIEGLIRAHSWDAVNAHR